MYVNIETTICGDNQYYEIAGVRSEYPARIRGCTEYMGVEITE